MPKGDLNKVAKQLRHWCSLVNLLHIFRTPFPKNTSEELFLYVRSSQFNTSCGHWNFLLPTNKCWVRNCLCTKIL